jgi:hypothetical protein
MLKIKPLVWEMETWQCQWIAQTPFGKLQVADRLGFVYYWLPLQEHGTRAESVELAQAAAEQWYRAKMMEGLEESHQREPTAQQIDSACMTFNHNFGLLKEDVRAVLRNEAMRWFRAWQKEMGKPFPDPTIAAQAKEAMARGESYSAAEMLDNLKQPDLDRSFNDEIREVEGG